LHWGVLYINGKFLKCRCPKWPRMCHLNICSPSYGQKKGRESNWQFDFWPLKVGNRPLPNIWWRSATRPWKALEESYNFGLDLTPIGGQGREIWTPKVPGLQPRTPTQDSFGTPPWESWEKVSFGCSFSRKLQRILHGGRWWLPLSSGRGESSESKCPWLVPTPKSVFKCELTLLGLVLDADSRR
jgi:hypothetical protein